MRWPYPRKPALGRNLPPLYDEGNEVFDKRVKAKFTRGMSEINLIEELRNQGFLINPAYKGSDVQSATIMRGLIFRTIWSVRWRADAGKVNQVWGVYGVIAP